MWLVLLAILQVPGAHQNYSLHGQPKSGTTWFEVIVDRLIEEACSVSDTNCKSLVAIHRDKKRDGGRDGAFESAEGEVQVVDYDAKHSLPGARDVGRQKFAGVLFAIDSSYDRTIAACVKQRVTIWSQACVPPGAFNAADLGTSRYLLIVRDPRAVTVSAHSYFQVKTPLGQYCRQAVWKVAALMSLRFYWFNDLVQASNPTLIVFYEDLIDDTFNQYYRIASFIRLHPSIDAMFRIIKDTTADAMRIQEKHKQLPGPNRKGKLAKVRKGQPDAFRDELLRADKMALAASTRAMRKYLHPALALRYLYTNEDDIHIMHDAQQSTGFNESAFLTYIHDEVVGTSAPRTSVDGEPAPEDAKHQW